jgi:hypothetical protein
MLHAASTHKSSRAHTKKHPASFEDILVHLDESSSAANALAYAEALLPDGNTTALMFGLLADYPMSYSSEVPMDAWLLVQERAKQTANEIEGRLKQKLARADSRAELRRSDIMRGGAGEAIGVQGRYSDLTVIGWPAGAGTEHLGPAGPETWSRPDDPHDRLRAERRLFLDRRLRHVPERAHAENVPISRLHGPP